MSDNIKKHLMLDLYGCREHSLSDPLVINDLLNELAYELKLNPITPPTLIPYYYGKIKNDVGISAYVLLEGGHITIHTFPIRECYFVDIFANKEFDDNIAFNYLMDVFPFDKDNSIKSLTYRSEPMQVEPYSDDCDFGPHLMAQINVKKNLTMENMFDYLENLVKNINMEPISRANIIKARNDKNNKFISGIIVIAQSHIAMHYNLKEKKIFADIFSCSPFEYDLVEDELKSLGDIELIELIPRGTKHIYKIKSEPRERSRSASSKWQKVLKIK